MTPSALVLLLASLLAGCAATEPGTVEYFRLRLTTGALQLPPTAYRMTAPLQVSGTLLPEHVLTTLPDVPESTCQHHCLHQPACLGTLWRASDLTCLLAARQPTPDRLRPDPETPGASWTAASRLGVAFLNESCVRDRDCRLAVPWSECYLGACSCVDGFTETQHGGCRPNGPLIPAHNVSVSQDSLLREEAAASAADCVSLCQQEVLCLSAVFSSGTCRLHSGGVTSQQPVEGAETFVVQPRLGLRRPSAYHLLVDGTWMWPSWPQKRPFAGATTNCAHYDGILWPGRQEDAPALEAAGILLDNIWIGLDDTGEEGSFVFSDGEPERDGDVIWIPGQPNNAGNNQHCVTLRMNVTSDDRCDGGREYVCQYMGDNLALNKPTRLSDGQTTGGMATDTDLFSMLRSTVASGSRRLTIDLQHDALVVGFWLAVGNDPANTAPGLSLYVSSHADSSEPAAAALCRRLPPKPMAANFVRFYYCLHPIQGRYIHAEVSDGVLAFAELKILGSKIMID